MARSQQHAMGLQPAHLARRKVGNDNNAPANKLFRSVKLRNSRENLPLFISKIDFKAKQLVRLRNALGNNNLGDAEVDLDEVVDGDLRAGVGGNRVAGGLCRWGVEGSAGRGFGV